MDHSLQGKEEGWLYLGLKRLPWMHTRHVATQRYVTVQSEQLYIRSCVLLIHWFIDIDWVPSSSGYSMTLKAGPMSDHWNSAQVLFKTHKTLFSYMLLNPYSIFTSVQIHPLTWARRYVPQKYKVQLCQIQGEHSD